LIILAVILFIPVIANAGIIILLILNNIFNLNVRSLKALKN